MTQEELFDRKTFINLLNKKDLDRTDEENKLYLIAKHLVLKKNLKKQLNNMKKV